MVPKSGVFRPSAQSYLCLVPGVERGACVVACLEDGGIKALGGWLVVFVCLSAFVGKKLMTLGVEQFVRIKCMLK